MDNELETEAFRGELKALRRVWEMVKHIDVADKLGGIYFIVGDAGEKDSNGLPEKILICPAYGVEWSQVYEKTPQTEGPTW